MDARSLLLRVGKLRLEREGEALRLFAPQPHQRRIFLTRARRLLIRGGNQSGKTVCAAVRGADLFTGHRRLLAPPAAGGVALLVSLDFSLLHENIYRKLFEPGAFDVCKSCRKIRPLCEDAALCGRDGSGFRDRAVEAPPLIPPRFLDVRKGVKGFAWLDRARGFPAACWLRTGWRLTFRTTDQGRSKFQGPQWDFVWADEEAASDTEIMREIERGLLKRRGDMQISATPLAAGITIFRWSKKAALEGEERDAARARGEAPPTYPFHEEVVLDTEKNRALDAEDVSAFAADLSDDEREIRLKGGFLLAQGLVFGDVWDRRTHLVDSFVVPQDWTIYDVADPGSANAFAILFLAVAPSGRTVAFDELYVRRWDLEEIAAEWKRLLWGGSVALAGLPRRSQATTIDPAANQVHAGARRSMSVKDQLCRLRRKLGLESVDTGFGMRNARNAVLPGIFAAQRWLKPRADGVPGFQVMRHLRHFVAEIELYRWPAPKEDRDVNERAGPIRRHDHLMADFRYAALAQLSYAPPAARPDEPWSQGQETLYRRILKKRRAAEAAARADWTRLA